MLRHLIRPFSLVGIAFGLAACGSFGDRSTMAEFTARCEQRGGEVAAGNSEAEGGLRCMGGRNLALASMTAGASLRTTQANAAVDRSLRGY